MPKVLTSAGAQLIQALAITAINALSELPTASGKPSKKRSDGQRIRKANIGDLTPLHGTAPTGEDIHSMHGKYLAPKGKLPAAMKLYRRDGTFIGVFDRQELLELQVAGQRGVEIVDQNGITDAQA